MTEHLRITLPPSLILGLLGPLFLAVASAWAAPPSDSFETRAGEVVVTPIQHASFTLAAGGKLIYIDPSPAALFEGRAKADLILITDIHQDHMDTGAIASLKKEGTKIIAPAAVARTVTDAQVLSNGQTTEWNGWRIEAVPMYNLTRGPAPGKLYHDKGRGNGYILTYGGKRFYIAGDTEGTPEMRSLQNIDVAFVPMNLPYTMTPAEAADAVKAFHPKVVYPYHSRGQKIEDFSSALSGSGIDVRLRDWYSK
jgi:L-ascorbate metabolism protein UlaG (beta-lactamase superfamily)